MDLYLYFKIWNAHFNFLYDEAKKYFFIYKTDKRGLFSLKTGPRLLSPSYLFGRFFQLSNSPVNHVEASFNGVCLFLQYIQLLFRILCICWIIWRLIPEPPAKCSSHPPAETTPETTAKSSSSHLSWCSTDGISFRRWSLSDSGILRSFFRTGFFSKRFIKLSELTYQQPITYYKTFYY